jgi:enamine deaminase RidA (YjgF/YER057c/UK114 family)
MHESGPVNPKALGAPKGYSNGILAPAGRVLFVAGQVAFDESGRVVPGDFTTQFARALDNVLAVVKEAGGAPTDVARMTVFVTSKAAYLAATKPIGAAWRARMGKHYPAMSLVEVKALVEDDALVEIEATAVIP